MTRVWWRVGGAVAALVLAVAAAGCASSSAFRAGQKAERRQDYDAALREYSKARRLDPDNVHYQRSLERARLRASEEHAFAARRLAGRGLFKEASDELRLALDLNPESAALVAEMTELEARRRGALPTSLDEIKERVRERALPGLVLGAAAQEPLGLSFRNASLKETYLALGKTVGVNFVFDPQFQDETIGIDLKDVPFEQALNALAGVGRTFHRVVDSRVVMVVPDTPNKRRDYEQQVVKTFFLSNADLKETIDLLRVVLGARRVAPVPGSNALTINDAPDKVAAAERIIGVVDKARAEVVVEVEILEVNRTRLKEYGIEIRSIGVEAVEGVFGVVGVDPVPKRTIENNPYRASNLLISNLPGVVYRLLQSDASTRLLANPQLRATEGQTAQARFGDLVPVPVTTFAPIATGSIAQQPITSFEYKNVGVNIDIAPRVHHDGDVTLNLKVEISSVGPFFGAQPSFNTRTVTSVIRLRDGETNLLAGLISDTERRSLTGLPVLSKLPFLGRLFSRNKEEDAETDIVMTLTPHVVRRPHLTEDDLRSFQIGGETSPLLFDVPNLAPLVTPPAGPPPRVEPIRPPPQPSPTPPLP